VKRLTCHFDFTLNSYQLLNRSFSSGMYETLDPDLRRKTGHEVLAFASSINTVGSAEGVLPHKRSPSPHAVYDVIRDRQFLTDSLRRAENTYPAEGNNGEVIYHVLEENVDRIPEDSVSISESEKEESQVSHGNRPPTTGLIRRGDSQEQAQQHSAEVFYHVIEGTKNNHPEDPASIDEIEKGELQATKDNNLSMDKVASSESNTEGYYHVIENEHEKNPDDSLNMDLQEKGIPQEYEVPLKLNTSS